MTFPRLHALHAAWRTVPPAAVTLARIAQWLGIKTEAAAPPAATVGDAVKEVTQAGLPVMRGRPDDPMLALCGL